LLPIPPESLRIQVGPFSDAELFARSGEEMVAEIVSLCGVTPNAHVLDVGCGCGRLARALPGYLSSEGRYEGFDIAQVLIEWCKQRLEPQLPNFHFSLADVRIRDRNPEGVIAPTAFRFPFPDNTFDLAIVSSVFTHMLPDEIENYTAQLSRVLKPDGLCFMSAFLFDSEAEVAVAKGSTIFDFRHPIGPCLTFDRERPDEGVACRQQWFLKLIERSGLRIDVVRPGNWRRVRSYQVSQDYVVARKPIFHSG
jgi:ubiquinone/menaquinone biosynthesis C-methylase UbiE